MLVTLRVLVIVKKSSPKNLSADCWSTVGRQVTDSLPTANQQVTDSTIILNNTTGTRWKTEFTASYTLKSTS